MGTFDQQQKVGDYSVADWNSMSALDARTNGLDYMDGLAGSEGLWDQANSFIKGGAPIFGLAGGLLEGWNNWEKNNLMEDYYGAQMKNQEERLNMTKQSYDNELWRSKMGNASLNEGMNSGPDQRVYMGTGTPQYGAQGPTTQNAYNAGYPAKGNAAQTGLAGTATPAAPAAPAAAPTIPKKKPNTL